MAGVFTSVQQCSGHKEGEQTQEQWVSSAEDKTGEAALKANSFKYTIYLSEVSTFAEFIYHSQRCSSGAQRLEPFSTKEVFMSF